MCGSQETATVLVKFQQQQPFASIQEMTAAILKSPRNNGKHPEASRNE